MKDLQFLKTEVINDVLVVSINCPGKVNKVSSDLLREIETIINQTKGKQYKGMVILSEKPDNFVVGADIDELKAMKTDEEIKQYISKANDILFKLEKLPFPTVSMINGNCLGGGVELTLVTDYRIATDSTDTVMGLPEIKLGLIPAAGGTQRLPRLIGIQNALPLILQGSNVRPRRAKRLGLIDEIVIPYGLKEIGVKKALQLKGKRKIKRKRKFIEWLLESNPLGRKIIFSQARKMVMKQTRGLYPAALAAIDSVEYGYKTNVTKGVAKDIERFVTLVKSYQSKSLMNLFFAMTDLKKNPLEKKAKNISKLAVIGTGLMGTGIAQVSLPLCDTVLVKDMALDAVSRSMAQIRKSLEKRARSGAIRDFDKEILWGKIVPCDDYVNFKNTDLVIEAVFEDLQLKQNLVKEVEAVTGDNTIFASNTSAIPISLIARASKRPQNMIGMHYFSPVPAMPLLEIIKTPKTADWVVATALKFGIAQGKTCIVVKDGPGFYTTRILAPYLNEAVFLIEEGVPMNDIDRALLQFGYPIGPVALLDEVGIDVGAHVAIELGQEFKTRGAAPSNVLPLLFSKGFKGKKNKKGFYDYSKPKKKGMRVPNEEIYKVIGKVTWQHLPMQEIQERVSLMMINEAALCLQEGIISSPRDGDVGSILGLGFPPFRGGIFRHIDREGVKTIVDTMMKYYDKGMKRFTPAQILVDMAKSGKRFYKD